MEKFGSNNCEIRLTVQFDLRSHEFWPSPRGAVNQGLVMKFFNIPT